MDLRPLFAFPLWVRLIGLIFPLTTSLVVLRGTLLEGADIITLWPQILFLSGLSAALMGIAVLLLKRGEDHACTYGTLTLF